MKDEKSKKTNGLKRVQEQMKEGITVKSLKFEFEAVYDDGSTLKQNYGVGEKNGEHHFGHIDLKKLKEFWLVNEKGERFAGLIPSELKIIIEKMTFNIEFPKSMKGEKPTVKMVYFRRVRHNFVPDNIVSTVRYALGYQSLIDGVNYQQFVFLNPDGTYSISQKK